MPSVKKMDGMVDEEGACWVDGLVVGREGYGSVMFPGLTNVAGLNLDEIGEWWWWWGVWMRSVSGGGGEIR